MSSRVPSVASAIFFLAVAACSGVGGSPLSDEGEETESALVASSPRIVDAKAGVDYPTGVPKPSWIQGKRILRIGTARIRVPESATIASLRAGIDYPTDAPVPAEVRALKLLVVGEQRVPLRIVPAEAGIDFPSDRPARSGQVWVLGETLRLFVEDIAALEEAVAADALPGEGTAAGLVAVTHQGTRARIGS